MVTELPQLGTALQAQHCAALKSVYAVRQGALSLLDAVFNCCGLGGAAA